MNTSPELTEDESEFQERPSDFRIAYLTGYLIFHGYDHEGAQAFAKKANPLGAEKVYDQLAEGSSLPLSSVLELCAPVEEFTYII